MPEPSSAFSSFVKWIGGILAAVITGLVLFVGQQYLTNHKWPWTKGQTTQTTKAAKIIPVDGRVVDSTRTKLIDNALVRMQVSSNHEEQQTDSEGRYAFSFDGFDPEFSASMSIDAPGYKQLRLNLPLSKLRQMKEQRLEPETPPPHPVGGGAAPGARALSLALLQAPEKAFRQTTPTSCAQTLSEFLHTHSLCCHSERRDATVLSTCA